MSCFSCLGGGSSKEKPDADHAGTSNGPPKKPQDPRIPLTERQVFLLQKNWKGISRKMELTGVTMFSRMFEQKSELFDIFTSLKHLRGKDRAELHANEKFESHALSVMEIFDQSVTSMGDADKFFAMIEKNAARHATKPGFQPEYFLLMKEPFLFAVRITLEDRYTDNMDQIYQTFIDLVLNSLCKETQKLMPTSATQVTVEVNS